MGLSLDVTSPRIPLAIPLNIPSLTITLALEYYQSPINDSKIHNETVTLTGTS